MRTLLVLVIVLAGCTEEVNVAVNCITTDKPSVECDVEQTKGKAEVEACWDFQITCGNGAVVKAPNACQKIGGGGKVKHITPGDKLVGLDKCGGTNPKAVLSNMTIDGKPSQVK
jgi:hypothetical protein